MEKRTHSPQALLEAACCLSFAAMILYLSVTGGYLQYVTPKTLPYLYFTAVSYTHLTLPTIYSV